MKLLVTGGAGFIGSCFARMAVGRGHSVLVADALTYAGNPANLDAIRDEPAFTFERVDITDRPRVEAMLEQYGPEAIVHFAAESHVDRSLMDAAPFLRTNTMGVQILLNAIRRQNRRVRFLQVSTDEVYGSADDGVAFTERHPLKPSSPYAASKAAGDLLALACARSFGLDVVVTRCSNNYGPFQFPEKVIPLFVISLLQGRQVPLYGDGLNVRDWIHVEDHCRGLFLALEQGEPGEVYNLGGMHPLSNLQLTHAILAATGHDERMIRYIKDRPGHDRVYLVDCSKARARFGWTPRIAFRQGLQDTVAWYRTHRAWWEAVQSGAYRTYLAEQYGSSLALANGVHP